MGMPGRLRPDAAPAASAFEQLRDVEDEVDDVGDRQ
jgi:hypothetical protein